MFSQSITELCRQLRRNETASEKTFWAVLRGRRFAHFKFRRQHPIIFKKLNGSNSFFVADFYCANAHLVIELDGKIHEFQKDYDQNRDFILGQLGLKTIRITNDVLEHNQEVVLDNIFMFLGNGAKNSW